MLLVPTVTAPKTIVAPNGILCGMITVVSTVNYYNLLI